MSAKPTGHVGFVHAVAFDGDEILFADNADGVLRRLDRPSGAEIERQARHADGVTAIEVTDQGVITGGYDGVVVTPQHRLRGHQGGVHSLAARDGLLASGGFDGNLCLWQLATGTLLARFNVHDAAVTNLAWLGDEHIASASRDCTIRIWNAREERETAQLAGGHDRWVTKLAPLANGTRLLSLGEDGRLLLWDTRAAKLLDSRRTDGVGWGLAASEHSTSGPAIAISAMPPVRWRVQGDALRTDENLQNIATQRAIAIDGLHDQALLGGDHGALTLIDLHDNSLIWQIERSRVGALVAASAGGHLLTGWQDGAVTIDERNRADAHAFMAYCCVGLGPDRAATAGFDGRICIWDCDEAAVLQELRYRSPYVYSLRASASTNAQAARLLATGNDGWMLWSLAGRACDEIARAERLGCGEHSHGDLSHDGAFVLIGGVGARLRLFAANGEPIRNLDIPPDYDPLCDARFLPDGRSAIIAGASGCIARIDLNSGVVDELHSEHEDWIRALSVSPGGRFVASVSQNFRLRVFDLRGHRLRKTPTLPIDAATFTAHGRLLACVARGAETEVLEIDLRDIE